ncbi:MAG: fibronectin type III domain-containing protein [Verrucomicrobia bacterium]|nr:fibronectin type III domain-containing protein [Verrucomicrobiota bacterium]
MVIIMAGAVGWLLCGFSAAAQTARNVTLLWDPPSDDSGIAGYRLYYGTTSGNYSQSTEVGNATTTTVSNLTLGQTYYFAVTDYNTAGIESVPSNEVSFTAVAVQNGPPTVSLTVSPSVGTRFVVPVSIVLSASASETNGSIARVEFYNQGTYLGEATSAPYTYTLSHPAAGSYSLTAVAVDDQGVSVTSNPVQVTMTQPPLPRVTP